MFICWNIINIIGFIFLLYNEKLLIYWKSESIFDLFIEIKFNCKRGKVKEVIVYQLVLVCLMEYINVHN